MNVVGKVGSLITQGVYSVATPFHPFGGAVDVIVVQQQDGTFRSTPWYVRFGKFQGVLKGAEKVVRIDVNGVEANFHMHLDNSGEAYFVKEVDDDKEFESNEVAEDPNNTELTREDSGMEIDTKNISYRNIDGKHGHRLDHSVSDSTVLQLQGEGNSSYVPSIQRAGSEGDQSYYKNQDEQSSFGNPVKLSEYGSNRYGILDGEDFVDSQGSHSEVVLVSVDGHILTAPISESEQNTEDVELGTPQFHLGPGEGADFCEGNEEFSSGDNAWAADYICQLDASTDDAPASSSCYTDSDDNVSGIKREDVLKGCLVLQELARQVGDAESPNVSSLEFQNSMERSVANCLVVAGIVREEIVQSSNVEELPLSSGYSTADSNRSPNPELGLLEVQKDASREVDTTSGGHSVANDTEFHDEHIGESVSIEGVDDSQQIPALEADYYKSGVVEPQTETSTKKDQSRSGLSKWRLWPIPFRKVETIEHTNSTLSNEEVFVDSESGLQNSLVEPTPTSSSHVSPRKQFIRTNVPTIEQIASLNLKEGQNLVNFSFSTRVLGTQQVDAHIYLWKWNARIVISDVDGTITKSDVLGQFMPLVGKDWTQSGVAALFSAIKENGYQLLFLSARAIVQAYLTRNFLSNLKQDGKTLPKGPIVISPDGLFPSLFREVIRRAPHEFKIACLEDIKRLFPSDYNPFYAGFGNRDTDELSYRKIGIPKGKIFIINPRGEVAVSHSIDVKSYTSLHTLVNDMFPPTSMVEQEDFNSWNYWKVPIPDVD